VTTILEVPAQRWHCRTEFGRLDIPDGLGKGTLAVVRDIHEYSRRHPVLARDLDEKMPGELQREILLGQGVPEKLTVIEDNLLTYGGASCQWQTLIGNGTTTAGQALTFFNNAQAAVGVGDSTTAAAATQTNLQAATNKLRVAMDSTYPQHTDATTSGAASIIFRSTFSTAQANYAWQEWGVFNSATDAVGRMLQRKVESLGTKTSSSAWTLTLTLSLA
jgi:hypothetical protein